MNSQPPLRLVSRPAEGHKGDFGRVLLIGGSRGMSGSIALSAMAALYSGAGLVSAAVPDCCLETVAGFHPAIMTIPLDDDGNGRFSIDAASRLSRYTGKSDAIGCGPGMTTEPGSVRIVQKLLSMSQVPRVFDADAINTIAAQRMLDDVSNLGPIVLTPHPGELQRLTGASAGDRSGQIEAAQKLAAAHQVVVVVKGGPTVVVGDRQSWTNTTGNPGMATAGSGDVLTGVITALLGMGLTTWESAKLGVWMHGRAGDLAADHHGQLGMSALEIVKSLASTGMEVME